MTPARIVVCRFPVIAALVILSLPAMADAQVWIGSQKPRPGSVEVSGGGFWTGGQDLPAQAATLTVNPTGGLPSFQLFSADPSLDPVIGVSGTVAVYLTRALAIEGGLQVSRPKLTVSLVDDFEDAPDVHASTTMTEYVFTGSLVYHFGGPSRTVPFVAAGAGHLRDVHVSNGLVETGTEYHGAAGVKLWFANRRKLGLRAEAGLSIRQGGFSYDEKRRIVPVAAASLLYLF